MPPGGDDQGHAEGDEDGGGAVAHDVDEAAVEVAVLHPQAQEVGPEDLVEQQQRGKGDHRPGQAVFQKVFHWAPPAMTVMTSSTETSSLLISASIALSLMTAIAVAHAQDFLEFGGDEEDGHPVGGEFVDELLDLGLGSDVDAAGGLVEDQEFGVGHQPAGQEHFLLVSAAEVPDQGVGVGRPDVEGLDVLGHQFVLDPAGDPARPALRGLHGQHQVVPDGEVADEAFLFAVLGTEPDALVDGRRAANGSSGLRP